MAAVVGDILRLWILVGPAGALVYGVAVCIFNYTANVVTPLLAGIVAGFARGGRLVVQAVAVQMLRLAAGPVLAAAVLVPGDYDRTVASSMALFAFCLVFALPPPLLRRPSRPRPVT